MYNLIIIGPSVNTAQILNWLKIVIYFSLDSAVYTPDDGGNWMLAKLNVQVTDFGYGQIVEHLAKVYLLLL